MLSLDSQQKIEAELLTDKLVSSETLDKLKRLADETKKPFLTVLEEAKIVDDEIMTRLVAKSEALPYVKLSDIVIPDNILNLLPKEVAESYKSVIFGQMKGRLAVAMLDPTNVQAIDFISRKAGQSVTAFRASQASIDRAISQYGADVAGIADLDTKLSEDAKQQTKDSAAEISRGSLQNLVQDAPITRALNTILEYAAQSRASDIHIEPRQDKLKVRYRIDGVLQESMTLPVAVEAALVSRIKILSNLKIDEHRIPQDGQYEMVYKGREIDLRIAIAPTIYGEQVVIRLLDKEANAVPLEAMGLQGRSYTLVKEGLAKPHGLTLSTGPTGSGKSTTLYALLATIKHDSINIVTLEDPVEYKMDGINQMQVNPEVGLTFASGLRSILRQDPNVVMVGEIRDKETADLALQSALTGHVVLSTLHTNSAAGVLPRLLDMDIEPFLIASTVNTVIGQRLVRRICPTCRQSFESTKVQTDAIMKTVGALLPKNAEEAVARAKEIGYENLPLSGQNAYTLYRGQGCRECTDGFKGRIGIFEVFGLTQGMERLLTQRATSAQVQDQAQKDGMLTMKQDGFLKVLTGVTTLEEVARVAADY